jgi:hypothetical protein
LAHEFDLGQSPCLVDCSTITNEGKETIMPQCEEDREMTHAILSTFVNYYVGTLHWNL